MAFENGPIFDEARMLYARSKIGLNWSSSQDLNARVFELMAMRLCPVINRVPDLPSLFLEDRDYLGFGSLSEAIDKVMMLHNDPVMSKSIADAGWYAVQPHTYGARINQILKECGF